MTIWEDTSVLTKISAAAPYVFIAAGAVVGMAGLLVKNLIDVRVRDLQAQEQVEFRNTPPEFDVFLARSEKTGKILLVIDTKNLLPFKARWLVTTRNDQVVSGILPDTPDIRPSQLGERFSFGVDIQDAKVVDNYLELRFSFESIYYEEQGRPPHLKGDITRRYAYVNGNIFEAGGNNATQH